MRMRAGVGDDVSYSLMCPRFLTTDALNDSPQTI